MAPDRGLQGVECVMQNLLFSSVAGPRGQEARAPVEPQAGASYSVVCMNVQNPGASRVDRLVQWFADQSPDVLVLSELQVKPACETLLAELGALGYAVTPLDGPQRTYHSVIASRLVCEELPVATRSLRHRVRVVSIKTPNGRLIIVGAYGPSFNAQNIENRRAFLNDFHANVMSRLGGVKDAAIIAGDLNIVEPDFHDHVPDQVVSDRLIYQGFGALGFKDCVRAAYAENAVYTWYSPRTFEGQRLDHLFANAAAKPWVSRIAVDHTARLNKLTDHSSIMAQVTTPAG